MNQALVWLRRDLRLHDHAALHHALRTYQKVWLCFIFDTTILEPLLIVVMGVVVGVMAGPLSRLQWMKSVHGPKGVVRERHGACTLLTA